MHFYLLDLSIFEEESHIPQLHKPNILNTLDESLWSQYQGLFMSSSRPSCPNFSPPLFSPTSPASSCYFCGRVPAFPFLQFYPVCYYCINF